MQFTPPQLQSGLKDAGEAGGAPSDESSGPPKSALAALVANPVTEGPDLTDLAFPFPEPADAAENGTLPPGLHCLLGLMPACAVG